MSEADYSDLQARHPKALSGRFWSLDRGDWVFTVAFVPIAVFIMARYGKLAALLLLVPLACWVGLMQRRNDGRVYRLIGWFVQSAWLENMRHNVVWPRNTAASHTPRPRKRQPPAPIPMEVNAIGELALLHDDRGYDMPVITGDGSSFIAADPRRQFGMLNQLAEEIKRTAAVRNFRTGVSFVFSRRPENMTAFDSMFDELIHPDVAVPEALLRQWRGEEMDADDTRLLRLHQATLEMQDMVEARCGKVIMAMTLNIKRVGLLARVTGRNNATLFNKQVARLPISRVANTARDGLAASGVANPVILDRDQMHAYLRSAWDVSDPNEYYRALADPAGYEKPFDPSNFHWPQNRIEEHEGYCIMDGTYASVLRVTRCPEWLLPEVFQPLYTCVDAPWRTIALVGDIVTSSSEVRTLNTLIPIMEGVDEARGTLYKSTSQKSREEALREREAHATQAGYTQCYMILVAVLGTSLDEVELGIEKMQNVIRLVPGLMQAEHITPANLQLRAVLTAVTGKNLL